MDYSRFKDEILALTGFNLDLYKEKQMKRRIDALVARRGCDDYAQFVDMLKRDARDLEFFCDYITINVTEFFRNPDHWQRLDEDVLPGLQHPRIWSVACSEGQEAYSLAMALADHHPLEDISVLATDINDKVLAKAQRGVYKAAELEAVPEAYIKNYFEEQSDGFRVCDELRRCVEFRKLNLHDPDLDMGRESFDMVVCRNVLIYFTDEAKQQLFTLFNACLKVGGLLFTGKTEQLLNPKRYGFSKICNWLYYKNDKTEYSNADNS